MVYASLSLEPKEVNQIAKETALPAAMLMKQLFSCKKKAWSKKLGKIIILKYSTRGQFLYGEKLNYRGVTGKIKNDQKFLGSNYTVVASNGHVRDLPKSQMGVDFDNDFEPKYITIRGKGELLASLRKEEKKQIRFISQRTLTAKEKRFPGICFSH